MSQLTRLFGYVRSWLIYYAKPLNQYRMRRFYRPFIPANGLCFDLGSHLGNRIPVFRKGGATVVAVEPHPGCLAYLRKQYGKDPRVIIEACGVSEQVGEADFYISDATPTVSTFAGKQWRDELNQAASFKSRWDRTKRVSVTTLDLLIEKYGLPDFTKIDVEGMEEAVLRGLSQPLPALSFEFFAYAPERAIRCIEQLEKLAGYQYNWSIRERHHFREETWLSATEMHKRLSEFQNQPFSGDIYARTQTLQPKK